MDVLRKVINEAQEEWDKQARGEYKKPPAMPEHLFEVYLRARLVSALGLILAVAQSVDRQPTE